MFHLFNITLSKLTLVHYLPGHGLQSGSVLHKIFDHAAHPSDLLFCTVRYILLSYPISHKGEYNLLPSFTSFSRSSCAL